MYTAAGVGVGVLSPTLRPNASLPLLKQTQTSPSFGDRGDKGGATSSHSMNPSTNTNGSSAGMAAGLAQAYSRASQSDSIKLQTAASLVYAARMRQEGFPYGLSGVPAMSSYSYSNELYGYASNGFPRKSRICSYCSKVFTRSTTRRYHEKRCPLLRAAGSLMKGNSSASSSSSSAAACNGFAREQPTEGGAGGTALSRPPPLLAVTGGDSPSPPASKSTSVNTSPTSEGLSSSAARAQSLNSSHFYNVYGSAFNHTAVSTSAQSAAGQVVPTSTGRPSVLDHNQNSILPVVKQEPRAEPEEAEKGKDEQVHDEGFLLRTKVPAEGEEDNQHQLFAASSPTSRSHSEEEEAESDDGDGSGKPPGVGGGYPMEDAGYLHMQQLALKRYKLAQLMALQRSQGMNRPGNMLYLPVPCVTNMTNPAEKPPREPETETQSSTPQKEEEHFPHHHSGQAEDKAANPPENDGGGENHQDDDVTEYQEDDDNTESYYEPHDNLENNDLEDEEEMEEEKKCGVCKEEFEGKGGLLVHRRCHQKYKPNCCRYCGQRFIKMSMRISHQRTHVGNFTLGCVVCGLHMLTKFGLRQHMHREHYNVSVGMTECRYCHVVIDNVYDLRVHFLTHRQEVALSERFSIQLLRNPLPELVVSSLEEESPHELPPASIESKTSHDSPTNMESESAQGPPPLLGPILPMASPGLEQSTFRANGGAPVGRSREKDWCRICQKEIPKSAMRYHEREHADQKPYECSLCKKRFGYKNNMKSHMKLHAGIKPYLCQMCGARFTRGSTLRRHARRHGINSDTIWDFFVRKNAASRTAVYNQGMDQAVIAAPERQGQGQSQMSPMGAGSRAMKVDGMFMAGLKPAEPPSLEKSRQMAGFPPSSSASQPMLSSYPAAPNGPQPMLQPCMTTHQYLRYAASFSSAAHPPAPPPQPVESEEALDFSMPEKQRRRNSSSSSSISTQRSPSSSSSLGMSPSLQGPGPASHCQSLPATLDRRRSMGSYSDEREMQEERRRNTISFHGTYNHFNKLRPSRYGPGEGMEHHLSPNKHAMDNRDGRGRPPLSQADSQNTSTQDTLCCFNSAATTKDPYAQKFTPGGCNPLDMTVSPRSMTSGKSSAWMDNLEDESLGSLLTSGRLFHCRPCDCFYTDPTMYRIHSKIHLADHPYLCFLCRQDCHDKVTFSRHMLAHLR